MGLRARLRAARALGGRDGSDEATRPRPDGEGPRSVAVIMDGNGRWASGRRLPVAAGHRAGAEALKRIVRHAPDVGIRDLVVFSFSTENWGRPPGEVEDLMELFCELIEAEVPELNAERVRLRFIGRRDALSARLRQRVAAGEAATAHNERLNLYVAMNYGGRAELVDAARRFAREAPPDAPDDAFAGYLYAPALRDPELLIRTSGEQRVSNFMLWQAAYAELVFSPRLWPDYTPADLDEALAEYRRRQRRFGTRAG